ncbi:hypothetical protein ACIBSV_42885 [Embleya sp. NPDC050154]|uniref:hypothetical protein n=1 Tax=Embleya sp. NPDC050154 TaxID=3363988 RepID=UPI003793B773
MCQVGVQGRLGDWAQVAFGDDRERLLAFAGQMDHRVGLGERRADLERFVRTRLPHGHHRHVQIRRQPAQRGHTMADIGTGKAGRAGEELVERVHGDQAQARDVGGGLAEQVQGEVGAVVQEQSPGGQAETRPFLRRPSQFRPDGWTIA